MKETDKCVDILELLLSQSPQYPEKDIRMERISKELGTDVVFKIRAIDYNTVSEFIRGKKDSEIKIILEGLISPNIKDTRLLSKYNALTPEELLKDSRFLRSGEVVELSSEIERLSGYRESTFKEVTKN